MKSVHLEKFIEIPKNFENMKLSEKWIELKKIRDVCNISIESKRAAKDIGSSLEANLIIKLNTELFKIT
jgi:isoleucyl-tRNA synthetase